MIAGLAFAGAGGAAAQLEDLPPVGPTTTAPGQPATTTTSPLDPVTPAPVATPPSTAKPANPVNPPGDRKVPIPGDGAGEGITPPAGAGPFPDHLAALSRSVKRSGPRNTKALMEGLRELTDLGMPLEEAMRVGMGRFPVAGQASYTHDWWYPRFGPDWRLHLGTDVFADSGTPLRSPADGVVRLSNGGLGGKSTYVVQSDGTYFYMAHLEGWPEGLRDGQNVAVGDIVGYVGTSGNASGGSPHLHFEVHPAVKVVTVGKGKRRTTKVVPAPVRPGTVLPAADPKPLLDSYLDEAMQNLPDVVAAYKATNPSPPPQDGGESVDPALVAPSLALAARKGLLLSEAQPAVSVPLLGLATLLVLMVGCLTPVLGTRASLPSARGRGRRRHGTETGETGAGEAEAGAEVLAPKPEKPRKAKKRHKPAKVTDHEKPAKARKRIRRRRVPQPSEKTPVAS